MNEDRLAPNGAIVKALQECLSRAGSFEYVPGGLMRVLKENAWRDRIVPQTKQRVMYDTFKTFVEDHPPEGLHMSIEVITKICAYHNRLDVIQAINEVDVGPRGGANNPYGCVGKQENGINADNISIDSERKDSHGTGTAYTLRRLNREYPKLFDRVIAGELTPNAAARQAGFRREIWQVPKDPIAAGIFLAQKVDEEWLEAFMDAYRGSKGVHNE